jgi:signal transduction histidine kinase
MQSRLPPRRPRISALDDGAQATAVEERGRIARELHGIVAEHLTTMVVQAEAAHESLRDGRECAFEALAAIEETGRVGLDEMRRLLGMLRSDGDHAELEPQPTLAQLPQLAREGIELVVEGERGRVAPGVDLAAYRLVQDALRTLGGEPARVVLSYADADLELLIESPSSHGLADADAIGPPERVSLHGGTLDAYEDGAGSVLRARLPRNAAVIRTPPPAGVPPHWRQVVARELHDVLAHSMSVMIVQAGAARRVAARDPNRARKAARMIEQTGRDALAELRRMLGILRRGDEAIALESQPTLLRVDALVRRAHAAGLQVELLVEGTAERLPPGLDLAAYRVAQEALTNVLQHAPGARAQMRIRYRLDSIEISIENDAPKPGSAPAHGARSNGLVAMRERVTLYGGEMTAGARADGGFGVLIRLPRRVSHPAGGAAAALA